MGAVLIHISRVIFPVLYEQRIVAGSLIVIVAVWWMRSLVGVFANWREPDARILRFSALGILAFSGLIIALRLLG